MVATPPEGSAAMVRYPRFTSARDWALDQVVSATAHVSDARPPSVRPDTSSPSSAPWNRSAEVAAPKATRAKATRATIFFALASIRLMASSRMSWAVGSLSRSRPELIAPAGLMKSWHSLPATRAASAWPSGSGEPSGRGVAVAVSVIGPCAQQSGTGGTLT